MANPVTDSIDLVSYARQRQLDELIQEAGILRAHVVIVGCGGVGFWAGILMAMLGHRSFTLIDGDKVEPSNLNRLPVPQTWVGRYKTTALRRIIRTLRPMTSVITINTHVVHEDLSILKDILVKLSAAGGVSLIDTTDDARIQQGIYQTVRDMEGSVFGYIKLGYEGLDVGAYKNYDIWIGDDYRPGYRTTNANAITSAIAAGLGLFKLFLGDKKDMEVSIGKIVGQKKKKVTT